MYNCTHVTNKDDDEGEPTISGKNTRNKKKPTLLFFSSLCSFAIGTRKIESDVDKRK